ncbi:LysR family transcriptional regulator [Hominifimenecus sp. rT4P-3]|uniref:LysR family transcriptional regulator n=1 Tax=Hominifimenecus sp. rT4P-3 TaxID=3242979 RepID=UPI003DA3F912
MNVTYLEQFLQLAKYEHVSQTADLLNISQPSLSKNISSLEEELGVKLFDRKGKHIKLNQNGEQFAHYAAQALQMLNTGVLTMKRSAYETLGTLTIVCYCYAGIITPCTADYSNLNPLTNFIVCEPALAKELNRTNSADFILCSSGDTLLEEKKEQFWVSQPLFQEKYILILSPRFQELPEKTSAVNLADFKDAPFVTMLQSNVLFSDITYQLCQAAGFFPKTCCQTDSFLVKMNAVDAGLGVALIPESCLPDAQKLSPGLKHYALDHAGTSRTICLMRQKRSLMSEAALDFWDFALDYFHCQENAFN